MYQRTDRETCHKKRTMKRRAPLLAFVAMGALVACSSGDQWERDDDSAELGQLEQSLYDSPDIRTTARIALIDAYFATLADGDVSEFCGLIVRKPDGTFRGSPPESSSLPFFCKPKMTLADGERVVGYYHSHTPASVPGISPKDRREADASRREYFVISTETFCAEQYSPSTGQTTVLGCPFP
jgi:proteasome lid subunit RPN8/RPN11